LDNVTTKCSEGKSANVKLKWRHTQGQHGDLKKSLLRCPNGRKDRREVKVKFTLEQATKAQRGSRGVAVLFL
jgi:hypothetical protein